MTELEAQLLDMLNQEREENEREKQERAKESESLLSAIKSLAEAMQSVSQQQRQIIELLQKPTEGDSLETTLRKVLNSFQESLTTSFEASVSKLIESKS